MSQSFEQTYQALLGDSSWTPAWIRPLREKAYQKFQELGPPTRQNEDRKYTSTRSLGAQTYLLQNSAEAQLNQLGQAGFQDADRLVFLDGRLSTEHSTLPAGITVQSMQDAIAKQDPKVLSALETETDSLGYLNLACLSSGALITVQKNAVIKRPVQLVFLSSEVERPTLLSPRNQIRVEKGAEVNFVETHLGQGVQLTNSLTLVHLEAGAQCRYVLERLLSGKSQHIGTHRFVLERDARIETFNLAIGGVLNRSHLEFQMTAAGSSAKLDGLAIAKGDALIDNMTEVRHLAPDTQSSQVYKSILDDKSRVIFNGKITIVRNAQRTDAQQLNKNLLLSTEAEVDSRPQLAIDADDVRCSHGATIGQLDEQELFYLQSRAISREDAQRMLAKAFVGDVIGRVSSPSLASRLETVMRSFGGTVE